MMGARKIDPDTLQQIAEDFEAGVPTRKICEKYGVNYETLHWNMIRLGAERPNAKPLPQRAPGPPEVRRGNYTVRHFTEEEDAIIVQLDRMGIGYAEIARRTGRRLNSITNRLMTLARHEARQEVE